MRSLPRLYEYHLNRLYIYTLTHATRTNARIFTRTGLPPALRITLTHSFCFLSFIHYCLLGQVVPLRAGETINWTFTDRPALDDADSKA